VVPVVQTPEQKAAADAADTIKKEEDEFNKEHGIAAKTKDGRENRLPYSRVKAITENAAKKAVAPFQAQVTELTTKVKVQDETLAQVGQIEHIMFTEPKRYLEILKRTVPGMAELLTERGPAVATAMTKPADEAFIEPMPQGSVTNADGSMGYIQADIQKLQEWTARKATHEALITARKEFNDRFAPFEAAEKQRKEAAANVALDQRLDAELHDAVTNWEGFKDNQEDILKALQTHPQMSLEGAYRHVVFPKVKQSHEAEKTKLAADRTKMRQELLVELGQAPRSTTAGTPVAQNPAGKTTGADPNASVPLEEVIRQAIAAAGIR
jgi:hypothetical protein